MDNNIDNSNNKKDDNDIFHKILKDKRAWVLGVIVILMFVTIGVYYVNKDDNKSYNNDYNNNDNKKREEEKDKEEQKDKEGQKEEEKDNKKDEPKDDEQQEEEQKEEPVVNTYKVKINIDFVKNAVLSKYDVKVKLEDYEKVMKHGVDHSFEIELKEGKRELLFIDDKDSSISKKVTIDVHNNTEYGYEITCHYDRIDVEEKYVDKEEILGDNEVKINFSREDFNDKKKDEVINRLKENGFTNIKEKPLYDIVYDITPVGQIKEVSIGGKTSYRRGDIFDKDIEIIVSYHMKDDDDPSLVKAPYSSKDAVDKNYKDVEKAFKNAGFNNIVLEGVPTEKESKNGKVGKVTVDYNEVDTKTGFKPDDKLVIWYYKYEKPKDPYSTFEYESLAKTAFERAGKKNYPYGIKFHWILKRYDFSYKGNGIWHIEVGVDVTNKYGTTAKDLVAYGDVNFKKDRVTFAVKSKY